MCWAACAAAAGVCVSADCLRARMSGACARLRGV